MLPLTPPASDTPLGARILKVNHAGEHGAVHIYAGQILVGRLTAPALVDELRTFQQHEERHRSIFAEELRRRGTAKCRSYWLCAAGGFLLGVVTGLFGRRAIAATTVAVEHVVLRHLSHQLATLGPDLMAKKAISAILAEEQEHHDRSAHHAGSGQFWPRLLGPVVAASTESVIWLGMRL
jgi:3-demethoxyubiquinol 3-hydroxylase